jgi:hypothetical protein
VPKRSNDFQRLIKLLEQQLAPIGASVEESAMLPDLVDGEAVEVDSLITLAVGPRVLRTAIECRDCSRKQTKPWIRELIGKYEHLAVDHVVAVSKLGFSAGALRLAAHANIETRSLEEAVGADWARELQELTSFHLEDLTYEHLEDTRVVLRGRYSSPPAFSSSLAETFVAILTRESSAGPARYRIMSLRETIQRLTDQPKHDALVAHACAAAPDGIARIWMQMPAHSYIYDVEKKSHAVSRIMISLRRTARAVDVRLEHRSYGTNAAGESIALAMGSSPDGDADVVLTQEAGRPPIGTVRMLVDGKEIVFKVAPPDPGRE